MRFAGLARVITTLLRGRDAWRRIAMYAVMERRKADNAELGGPNLPAFMSSSPFGRRAIREESQSAFT